MRLSCAAPVCLLMNLAFALADSRIVYAEPPGGQLEIGRQPPLLHPAPARSNAGFLLAAATAADRRQSGQLVAEAALLLDEYGGEGNTLRQAEAKLRTALELNPDEAAAHVEIARLAMKSAGSLDPATLARAEASIRHAVAIAPGFGDAYVLLGYVLTQAGRLNEADTAFIQARRAGATSPWLEPNLADLRDKQGQERAAAEIYTRVAAAPAQPKAIRAAALQRLQEFYSLTGQYELADLAYRNEIELDPAKPFPKGNYSSFLRLYRLDLPAAESYARQALALMDYGMARKSLALTLYLRWAEALATGGNPRQADALFAEASRLNSDMSLIVREIGYYPRPHPILDMLVSRGISIDSMPGATGGTTPLSVAVGGGRTALATQMLQLGANPNTQGYQGVTPLMLAAQRGDDAMVRVLLTRNAEPGLVAENGKDAERHALEQNHLATATMLAAAKRSYIRSAGPLTASVPFRSQTIYRAKKDFAADPYRPQFMIGEQLVFDGATAWGNPSLARFNFRGPEGRIREFFLDKDKIGTWVEYFEEVGPAPSPPAPPSSR